VSVPRGYFPERGPGQRVDGKNLERTGLSVVVDILDRVYETGRKVAEDVKQALNIFRDDFLPLGITRSSWV